MTDIDVYMSPAQQLKTTEHRLAGLTIQFSLLLFADGHQLLPILQLKFHYQLKQSSNGPLEDCFNCSLERIWDLQ